MDKKLYNGLRVVVDKISCGDNKFAGAYKIQEVEMYSTKMEVELSGGQPFDSAFREAERLAVLVNAELVLKEWTNQTILREVIKGEYK